MLFVLLILGLLTDKIIQLVGISPRIVSISSSKFVSALGFEYVSSKMTLNLSEFSICWAAKGTDWEFIPHASTWLNQERFEDELVIEQKENKRPPLPWYASDELTLAKGRELGLNPYAGESFAQFRARLSAKIGSVGVGS